MAVKPAEGTVLQVCRVCGGEVNPHGECVVCGTKQSDPPKTEDPGTAAWIKGESSDGDREATGARAGDRAHQERLDCRHQVRQNPTAQGRRLAGDEEASRSGDEGPSDPRGRPGRATICE